MPSHNELSYGTLRLRAKLARLAFELRLHNLRLKAGFDPNQPRAPRGNPDGGQWTRIGAAAGAGAGSGAGRASTSNAETGTAADGGAEERVFVDHAGKETWRTYVERHRPDGSVEGRTILNRDGSRITTEFGPKGTGSTDQRNTVTLADGSRFTFENSGKTQRIFDKDGTLIGEAVWTPDGPVPQPIVQQVAMGAVQADQVLEAGRTLYEWLSTENTYEEQAYLAFRAWQYAQLPALLLFAGTLTREETGGVCKRLEDVQELVDQAVRLTEPPSSFPNAGAYGTAVHIKLKELVDELGDPTLQAEKSFMRTDFEPMAVFDSIKVDVIEYRGNSTVCIYDLKTGRGLNQTRIQEFASRMAARGYRTIIIIEVRPSKL